MSLENKTVSSWVFGIPIVLGSFLLFQIQPLITKTLLPTFGGSPAVWILALVFFQVLLFVGYAYAHVARKFQAWEFRIHVCLLLLSVLVVFWVQPWRGVDVVQASQARGLLLALLFAVGLPYTVLASTSPLVQRYSAAWVKLPYRYYALSNAASLAALITFPILELFVSLTVFWALWSVLFVAYVLMTLRVVKIAQAVGQTTEVVSRASIKQKLSWLGLSASGSLLLVSVSTVLTQDMVAAPLVWIIPLCWYLLSFILNFESDNWFNPKLYALLTILSGFGFLGVLRMGEDFSLAIQVVVSGSLIFCGCMLLHGYLARQRPANSGLTSFYVWMSLGGCIGGIFASLLAPAIFPDYIELHVALLIVSAAAGITLFRLRKATGLKWIGRANAFLALGPVLFGAFVLFDVYYRVKSDAVASRNFYGVLRVRDYDAGTQFHRRVLSHGTTKHGAQFLAEGQELVPTTYYGTHSGFGRLMKTYETQADVHVGVIGLGVGTSVGYGKQGDLYEFYEINREVIHIAKEDFSYIAKTLATVEMHEGDARIVLERQESKQFDILVLDAFSGDAVPAHLLTTEALDVYLRHVKPDGVIAIHTSNRYVRLKPVLAALVRKFGLHALAVQYVQTTDSLEVPSEWVLLAKREEKLLSINREGSNTTTSLGGGYLWTDEKNSIVPLIRY